MQRALLFGLTQVRLLSALLTLSIAAPAAAHTVGIAGFSGQQALGNGQPLYCSNAGIGCHFTDPGTKAPVVRFDGPTQVDPGAQATYTFVVTSQNPQGQTQAGFDVAASGGTLGILPDQQEQICSTQKQPSGSFTTCPNLAGVPIETGGEVTHTGPKDNQNGAASWQFTWTAPTTSGVYILFGAGNSTNADTTDEGDDGAVTKLMITVGVACAGDCNGDGTVSVNELVLAVNIALGALPITECSAADTDDDGIVSITELVAAVNKALNGC
jgi:hypothetical protein